MTSPDPWICNLRRLLDDARRENWDPDRCDFVSLQRAFPVLLDKLEFADETARIAARTTREQTGEVMKLRARVKELEATLAILAEHEPSWSDDFCRARAALGGPVR